MPEREISKRGGALRWRTVKFKDGRTVRIAVVKRAGPRGGHTVASTPHRSKTKG